MRLWRAISVLALTIGATAVTPIARADNTVQKSIGEIERDVRDELRADFDDGAHMRDYKHVVIIYQENHSFDNL